MNPCDIWVSISEMSDQKNVELFQFFEMYLYTKYIKDTNGLSGYGG